jgi:uncharacterized protein YdeI (YjbR/CyaY-like superfamily)
MAAPAKPKTAPAKPNAASADARLACASAADWHDWLAAQHASSRGVWLLIAKKDGGRSSVTYAEAIEAALIWGWIDGQKNKLDDAHWLQRFSPRAARSPWSKINRDKATALEAAGKLAAPGLAEVQRARADGRWASAYDGARTASVPDDLAAALAASPRAAARFPTLDGSNRYAILWRIQTAKLPETRARRISDLVAMLARGELLHPPRTKAPPKTKMKTPKTKAPAAKKPVTEANVKAVRPPKTKTR